MIPLKISSLFDRPPPAQPYVAPAHPRAAVADSPKLVPVEAVPPDRERRMQGNRRSQERREKEQALFLDTRTSGRRRSPGRRADDQFGPSAHHTISIKA